MKTTKIFFTIILLSLVTQAHSQQVSGKLTVNNDSRAYLKIGDIAGESQVVNLFKDFKQDKHKIKFSFQGKYPTGQDKLEFSFFKFKTTVKYNGKTIKSMEREPMPYIPGDMWLPAEAFDFVSILAMHGQEGMGYRENTGEMQKGEYEITLEAIPMKTEGTITKGLIMFNVK